jgi:hypothetical protein
MKLAFTHGVCRVGNLPVIVRMKG